MRLATGLAAVTALTVTLNGGIAAAADSAPAPKPATETAKPAEPAAAKTPAPETKPTDTVVTVNGTKITRADLDRSVQALLSQSRMPAPTDPEQKKKLEESALNNLIGIELLLQTAKKLETPELNKSVDEQIAKVTAQFPSKEEYEKFLKTNKLTDQDVKDQVRKGVLINNYIEKELTPKVKVTPEQVRKFYDENLDKIPKKPESVHASHILIGVDPKATAEEKEKAKKKAEELLTQVKGGADFAELAKKESTCPSGKNGGDLGDFGRGQMVKPLEDAAFSLKQGEVSGVVETQFGFHIIKSAGKTEGGTVPFDQIKGQIEEYLKKGEIDKLAMARVEELKKVARIEYPAQKK